MSVCSRLVKLPRKVRAKRFESLQIKQSISLQTRAEFQNYFSNLMKTGNNVETGNQQQPEKSDEDLLWQSELKGKTNNSVLFLKLSIISKMETLIALFRFVVA